MKKIAYICDGTTRFIEPIVHGLEGIFESNIVQVSSLLNLESQEQLSSRIQELFDWADIVWLEFADTFNAQLSKVQKKNTKIIVRMHGIEAYTDLHNAFRWEKVDLLVCVSDHLAERLKAAHPGIENKTRIEVIHNPVDYKKFPPKKIVEPTNKVVYVGYIRHTKNLPFLIQCFAALQKIYPDLTLHILGEDIFIADEPGEIHHYLDHIISELDLTSRVFFHGFVDDVNSFLESADLLISTSIRESFGLAIAEAMVKGVPTLVHNYPGAKEVFLPESVFSTIDEFVEKYPIAHEFTRRNKEHIIKNYSPEIVFPKLIWVLESLITEGGAKGS